MILSRASTCDGIEEGSEPCCALRLLSGSIVEKRTSDGLLTSRGSRIDGLSLKGPRSGCAGNEKMLEDFKIGIKLPGTVELNASEESRWSSIARRSSSVLTVKWAAPAEVDTAPRLAAWRSSPA